MLDDWRFRASPHVHVGGLRSYAGAPLRLETDFGESVALGSLCVASNTNQEPLTRQQQISLARLADWVVADIVQSARTRRQRDRRRMTDLMAKAQQEAEAESSDQPLIRILEAMYPNALVTIQFSKTDEIMLDGRGPIDSSAFQGGLWEDIDYLDEIIDHFNHKDLPTSRVVRAIAVRCENESVSSFLVIASKDFRLVFDDVDSWFVHACASMISQVWHKHLLREAMMAKEKFLRGITHQLRTPIHGILGSADLLAEELKSRYLTQSDSVAVPTETPEKSADPFLYINTIKTAGQDLISIVNSMITLNQWADIATTKRVDALHTIRDLGVIFSSAVTQALSGDTGSKPSLFMHHEFPPEVDGIWIDLQLLKHSLLPLFLNAIQNTPNGVVTITATLRQDYKELVVDIEDTGCGIHPDHQKRIFDAYEKVDIHSTGAGLGLTLASKFATLLGGSVALVSSAANCGSHFRATFSKVLCQLSSFPRPQVRQALSTLPSSFHKLVPACGNTPLSDCLARYLTYHGFSSSESVSDAFMILDYESDLERRQKQFSLVLPDQVAICLIPAAQVVEELENVPQNIVLVKPPFLSSTLTAALERADAVLLQMQAAKALSPSCDEPEIVLADPMREMKIKEEINQPIDLASVLPPIPTEIQVDPKPELQPATPSPTKCAPISPLIVPIFPTITKSSKPAALLVDDNAINLRIMQMYCNKRNLPFYCATDGRQAVDIFAQHQSLSSREGKPGIELVLMDLQMPVCDGIEATSEIRKLEKQNDWARAALFIVTGQDSPVDRTSAEDAGADEYFVKPVGIKLLDRAVKQYFAEFKDS